MSQYYKPNRKPNWNYGGDSWRLSRSKIDLFVGCPKCFYIDNKLGVKQPGYPAFTLNVAVDALLKKEFDIHRVNKTAHPLMKQYDVDAIPFEHEKIDVWRENFKGVECKHGPTGLIVSGAVDDIWINPKGELLVVDYKATSKDGKIETLADSAWEEQYARQIGVYQWLLRQNGFKVSDVGYFVYANASKDKEAFDGKLEFDVTIIAHKGDDSWIEKTLEEIKNCLDADSIPAAGADCDYCSYRNAVEKVINDVTKPQKRLL